MYAEREAILDKVLTSSFMLQMECYTVCMISMLPCVIIPHSFCSSSKCILQIALLILCTIIAGFSLHVLCPQYLKNELCSCFCSNVVLENQWDSHPYLAADYYFWKWNICIATRKIIGVLSYVWSRNITILPKIIIIIFMNIFRN